MKARIKFAKSGSMKYVGHLDIMRYFQKAIRRSGIPIKYSEGFNPHQIMSFAAPLGVGITSAGEYLDIELKEAVSTKEAKKQLQSTMVEGMDILKVQYLPKNTPNAMASLAAATYRLTYKHPEQFDIAIDDLKKGIFDFYINAPTIPIIKKTKKGQRELDLKPLIYDFDVKETDGKIAFYLFVSTGSVDNIKPELVMEHYFDYMGIPITQQSFFVHRFDMFTRDEETFLSLGEIGYETE